MKKILITAAILVASFGTVLQSQAQTTSSEGNAANPAQSKNGNAKEEKPESGETRAKVSRTVTGSRPAVNSTSDKFGENSQPTRENRVKRAPSDADGKISKNTERPKADLKTKKKRSKGRTFGNTNDENQ